jgi:hypothetical protein
MMGGGGRSRWERSLRGGGRIWRREKGDRAMPWLWMLVFTKITDTEYRKAHVFCGLVKVDELELKPLERPNPIDRTTRWSGLS